MDTCERVWLLTWNNAPEKGGRYSLFLHLEPLLIRYDFEAMSRLLNIKRRFPQETSRPGNNQKPKFAGDSGLVYTEYTCNGSPMTPDWTWKTRGSSHEHGHFRSLGPGCSSLFNMAARSALLNNFSITPESLETLPWRVGQLLWRRFRLW